MLHPEQKDFEALYGNLNQSDISNMTKNAMWSYIRTGMTARLVGGPRVGDPVPYNDAASPAEKLYPVFVLKTEYDKYNKNNT